MIEEVTRKCVQIVRHTDKRRLTRSDCMCHDVVNCYLISSYNESYLCIQ